MQEGEIPRVFFKPADGKGPACLSVEVDGLKRYRRVWFLPEGHAELDWGWVVADTAVELTPQAGVAPSP